VSVEVVRNIFAKKGAFEGLKESSYGVALKIATEAKQLAPRDYGELANSIMVKSVDNDDLFNTPGTSPEGKKRDPNRDKSNKPLTANVGGPDAIVGTNSDHWYPEFRTRYQTAKPFMRPAAEVVIGGNAAEVAKKYGKEAMQKEFAKRKVEKKKIG
jgi:hypothetical protein